MELAAVKGSLEEWYAQRLPEESVVDEVKAKFEALMGAADSVVAKHTGTIKTVKAIVDTCLNFAWLASWLVPVLCARVCFELSLSVCVCVCVCVCLAAETG